MPSSHKKDQIKEFKDATDRQRQRRENCCIRKRTNEFDHRILQRIILFWWNCTNHQPCLNRTSFRQRRSGESGSKTEEQQKPWEGWYIRGDEQHGTHRCIPNRNKVWHLNATFYPTYPPHVWGEPCILTPCKLHIMHILIHDVILIVRLGKTTDGDILTKTGITQGYWLSTFLFIFWQKPSNNYLIKPENEITDTESSGRPLAG